MLVRLTSKPNNSCNRPANIGEYQQIFNFGTVNTKIAFLLVRLLIIFYWLTKMVNKQ